MKKLADVLNANPEDIKAKALITQDDEDIDVINTTKASLSLLSDKDILANYYKAKESMEKALDAGLTMLDSAKTAVLNAPQDSMLLERTAKLITAINEVANSLAGLHRDIDVLPGLKKIEIDNSTKEFNMNSEAISKVLSKLNKNKDVIIDVEPDNEKFD